MELTRREFVGIIAAAGLAPAGAESAGAESAEAESPIAPPGGDDHPAFSEFAEFRLVTQWDATP